MDPDDQNYISKDMKYFNGLLKSYKGHTENEWIAISKIWLVLVKI